MHRFKTAKEPHIYEYVDDEGVVFWSFTRLPHTKPYRLRLVFRWGERVRTHIRDLLDLSYSSSPVSGDQKEQER